MKEQLKDDAYERFAEAAKKLFELALEVYILGEAAYGGTCMGPGTCRATCMKVTFDFDPRYGVQVGRGAQVGPVEESASGG